MFSCCITWYQSWFAQLVVEVKYEVVDVVVDSSNYENIINRVVIEKLGLLIDKHPDPYTIRRIKAERVF